MNPHEQAANLLIDWCLDQPPFPDRNAWLEALNSIRGRIWTDAEEAGGTPWSSPRAAAAWNQDYDALEDAIAAARPEEFAVEPFPGKIEL